MILNQISEKFTTVEFIIPSARHARNPRKILLKLFDLFLKRGGKFDKTKR